ncbi:MAG: hypothetical protein IJV31_03305 [Clostridia bacterium]|nr:hypothetical protein [Clostridia bacterium]
MVKNEKKIKKVCSFYASDFHLEMIILPYINEKLKEEKEIKIITEENLEDSMNVLLSKLNIDNKEQILNIDWNNKDEKLNNEKVVFVNGSRKYIEKINNKLEKNYENIEIINCYKFDEVKNDMVKINEEHDDILNVLKYNHV